MKPFDLHGLKTYELGTRPSKVFREDLGRPVDALPYQGGYAVADEQLGLVLIPSGSRPAQKTTPSCYPARHAHPALVLPSLALTSRVTLRA